MRERQDRCRADASADPEDTVERRPARCRARTGDLDKAAIDVDCLDEVQHRGVANLCHHDVAKLDLVDVDRLNPHGAAARDHRLHRVPESAKAADHTEPHLPNGQPEHGRSLGGGRGATRCRWTTDAVAACCAHDHPRDAALSAGMAAARSQLLALRAGSLRRPPTTLPYMGTFAVAWLAGLLAIYAPGGLGVREAVLVALLHGRIGAADALVVAAASRLVLVLADVLLAAVSTAALRRRGPRLTSPAPLSTSSWSERQGQVPLRSERRCRRHGRARPAQGRAGAGDLDHAPVDVDCLHEVKHRRVADLCHNHVAELDPLDVDRPHGGGGSRKA